MISAYVIRLCVGCKLACGCLKPRFTDVCLQRYIHVTGVDNSLTSFYYRHHIIKMAGKESKTWNKMALI